MTDPTQPDKPEEIIPSTPPPPPVVSPPYMTQQGSAERPTLVTVVAVVLLIFAGFTALSLVGSVVLLVLKLPNMPPMPQDVIINGIILGLIGMILYIVMGIGLLRLAPWARKGTIISLIVLFVLGVANSLWTTAQMPAMPVAGGAPSEITGVAKFIGAIIGLVISLIINGLMIIALTRPNVKEAFHEQK